MGWGLLLVLTIVGGCATTGPQAGPYVYFPPPPAAPHAVHLKSFNSLRDIVKSKVSFVDMIRGLPIGPHVARPAGIAFHNGHLYVCDSELGLLHDWDLRDGQARRLGTTGNMTLSKPVAVSVGIDGTVYVADTARGAVLAFDGAGALLRTFKPSGAEPFKPVAVALDGTKLYVADIAQHRIDVFSTDNGSFVDSFGRLGDQVGDFYFPMGLATDSNGEVFVSDMMNSRVQVFDSHYKPLQTIGQPGDHYGDLGKPRHLALGPDGVIFIADVEFAHVHLFNRQGKLLMLLGGPGDQPGSTPMPVGVAVARSLPVDVESLVPDDFQAAYYLFVTNSVGRKKISLFAVGTSR